MVSAVRIATIVLAGTVPLRPLDSALPARSVPASADPIAVVAAPTRRTSVAISAPRPRGTDIDAAIAEAAARFQLPADWIRAVIRAESAGVAFDAEGRPLISRAGAIGLMQLMPATYAAMARAQGLGPDPSVPRDNILAGTAFLRLMYDRFGSPGFLAAYNAGPGRWADHLATGAPLPRETRAYLASVGGRLGLPGIDVAGPIGPAAAGVGGGDRRAAQVPVDTLFAGSRSPAPRRADALFFILQRSSGASPTEDAVTAVGLSSRDRRADRNGSEK